MAIAVTRKSLLVPLLVASHLGLVAVMLLQSPAVVMTPVLPAMVVTAIAAPGDVVAVAPPPIMTEPSPVVAPPEFLVAADDTAVATEPCELADNVQNALRQDRNISVALARIPLQARSVSNSVLLWDGAWALSASVGGEAAIGPIRASVAAQVRAAPAACRTEMHVGPRLVVLPDERGEIVLAFGSGQWNWEKLL